MAKAAEKTWGGQWIPQGAFFVATFVTKDGKGPQKPPQAQMRSVSGHGYGSTHYTHQDRQKNYLANMLTDINPKLPMRDKARTKDFYLNSLGFKELGDYGDYLMVGKDQIEIHFFEFKGLDPEENYGQVYIRTDDIAKLYQSLLENKTSIHPNGHLQAKPWGQLEFALLDPDNNLLTFGQNI